MMTGVEIPYGCYWSSPFVKWQGALQHLNSVEFAAWLARRELERRSIDTAVIDHGILGITVPQHRSFYGLPWLTGMLDMDHVAGQTVSQVCATGVRAIASSAQEIMSEMAGVSLVVTADRCSNGPHVFYPEPSRPGGTGTSEDIVIDNFKCDPLEGHSMLQTAENVAAKHAIDTQEQHDVVLQRFEQYQAALADDRAFQKRYMSLPFEVPRPNFRRIDATIEGDEGVFESTAEGLAKLRPVHDGGTVTFGGQTHPADGNAAMLVAASDQAQALSRNAAIKIEPAGFGQARVARAHMPEAPVPAAQAALRQAGIGLDDLVTVKTHNPFAVNDIYFSRALDYPLERMNNFGCSLIWGHPQGPTGLRSVIELIEELVARGGGYGLFTGCAAGDSGMAVVIRVTDR